MRRKSMGVGIWVVLLPVMFGACVEEVVANESEMNMVSFGITTNGGGDYGNNEISVSEDGWLRVEVGDTVSNEKISGVGLYEARLDKESSGVVAEINHLLCASDASTPDGRYNELFNAKCEIDGKVTERSSNLGGLGRDRAKKVMQGFEQLKKFGLENGRAIVKLDASVQSIVRSEKGIFVTVRFSNNGQYPISFDIPEKWRGGRNREILGVNGSLVTSDDVTIGFALAGRPMLNKGNFPDENVAIAPFSVVDLTMKGDSDDKFPAGVYEVNAVVHANIKIDGIPNNLNYVNFHSDYKNPARVTFDRDYPSTPQEREQWESTHRASMSYNPVKPGETFVEDGLYRAVRLNSGGRYRSLQVMSFKAGDVATTDSVKMPMESGDGLHLNGPVQWIWEGSAPIPTKLFSSDYVEGTEQFCMSGATCPRGGRWMARVRVNAGYSTPEYRYDLSRIVTMRRGQPMPSIPNDAGNAEWEWVGA
ncbi:hypothetical protein [Burkholderia ubonensis]|uniref:hypothetical protein n=1 Tax=Burkholderia ubonensis TaxID=101571 RepID=UPI0012FBCAA5|nr:hypothetical protein [Burkholderia ubonensis]